ncbi:MAG: class I SAM-dependent methyltransferase [Solirubrobacteraceae bacterium]
MASPRRLVFGQVAELYDRSRPSYPDALIDDLLGQSGLGEGDRALEVGAGTGKATRLIGARGIPVLAIEPSAEMAAVARRACAQYPLVEVVESDFESWEPRAGGDRFRLLFSAQAWHWIDPAVAYLRARAALADGGLLAAFWNRPAWGPSELRRALSAAYHAAAPEMGSDGPLHPDNTKDFTDENWHQTLAAADGFADAEVRRYPWELVYSAQAYADLLATLSEVRLLESETRERLLAGVRATIDEYGGALAMPMETGAGLARAV